MKLRIYIDTSVIGGCLDEEFKDASMRLIDKSRHGQIILIISDLTKLELADAEHIAIATINRVDILVSWNFHHIVNLKRIRGYNSVNLKYEYPLLEIRSPSEVLDYED